jgi:phage FluMu protein Com
VSVKLRVESRGARRENTIAMPIRFRCAYCNQLLGIARRKAGTIVRCPTCAGQVIVPTVESDASPQPRPGSQPFVFERSDFDDILNTDGDDAVPLKARADGAEEAPASAPAPIEAPAGAWGTHAEPPYDMQRLKPTAAVQADQVSGIVLSRTKATVLVIAAIILLALVFAAGVLVGFVLHGRATVHESRQQTGARDGPEAVVVFVRRSVPSVLTQNRSSHRYS